MPIEGTISRFSEGTNTLLRCESLSSLISTPTFLASSLEASARLGASLTERIPWSVQLRDSMNVGMCSSLSRLDDRSLVDGLRNVGLGSAKRSAEFWPCYIFAIGTVQPRSLDLP